MNQKRIIVKLSGESFAKKEDKFNISTIERYAKQIKELHKQGYEVCIVVGGGNLWRGQQAAEMGLDRASADYIGMVATIMNGLVLHQILENKCKLDVRTLTAVEIDKITEPYIRKRAIRHLEKGRVLIFAGGIGSPYFTTDTCAVLRANEIGASKILMAKNGVDGVYDKDPNKHRDAVRLEKLTYNEVLTKNIKIMDKTAITMCAENDIELFVFSVSEDNSIVKVLNNEIKHTRIIKG